VLDARIVGRPIRLDESPASKASATSSPAPAVQRAVADARLFLRPEHIELAARRAPA
jgi:hypothetical protein